ncbi:uncharacterized protein [Palaemon carinicauda]|uniref:uncharacterized protein n=1 Tax=Palaemon carinicauda TaxID=392227 RepID=UPI0035B61FA4
MWGLYLKRKSSPNKGLQPMKKTKRPRLSSLPSKPYPQQQQQLPATAVPQIVAQPPTTYQLVPQQVATQPPVFNPTFDRQTSSFHSKARGTARGSCGRCQGGKASGPQQQNRPSITPKGDPETKRPRLSSRPSKPYPQQQQQLPATAVPQIVAQPPTTYQLVPQQVATQPPRKSSPNKGLQPMKKTKRPRLSSLPSKPYPQQQQQLPATAVPQIVAQPPTTYQLVPQQVATQPPVFNPTFDRQTSSFHSKARGTARGSCGRGQGATTATSCDRGASDSGTTSNHVPVGTSTSRDTATGF